MTECELYRMRKLRPLEGKRRHDGTGLHSSTLKASPSITMASKPEQFEFHRRTTRTPSGDRAERRREDDIAGRHFREDQAGSGRVIFGKDTDLMGKCESMR